MTMNALSTYSLPQAAAHGSPYVAYAYSYPHKTAYRPLVPARLLSQVWAAEPKHAMFLYLHVPFCEMRCGFCNLFTTTNARGEITDRYLDAIERHARITADALGPERRVARMAIGGGTPTYLSAHHLERLLSLAGEFFGVAPSTIPISVETSPRTAQQDRLVVLKSFGVDRISIGVQSFIESEVSASGRAQKEQWVDSALERIRAIGFPTLNLDLIYGLPGQTVESWLRSLRAALRWQPEELYLYPLYVRPLTGLDRRGASAHDTIRLQCYRAGRDLLSADGYEQVSMRMFRRSEAANECASEPVYCCQDDGMVGLGCGARSYTRELHYSTEYAVGASGVREILADYVGRSERDFARVDYGAEVDESDQRRRWLIKSLFRTAGLDRATYLERFGSDPIDDSAELGAMVADGYFVVNERSIVPTAKGLEWSDALAPALFSEDVRQRMASYELR